MNTHGSCITSAVGHIDTAVATDLKHIPYQAVSDDGDGALEQRVAVQVVVGLEVGPQQCEAQQRVDVDDDETQHRHPQQRHTCTERCILDCGLSLWIRVLYTMN